MRPTDDMPAAFRRFADMGGVLDFALFEDARGTEAEILAAMPGVLHGEPFDPGPLHARPIDQDSFFGDWYDPAQGLLLKRGDYSCAGRKNVSDPPLATLDQMRIVSGGCQVPEVGAGGQFAYAFCQPPYPLSGRPSEVQALFAEIRDHILPPGKQAAILDWSSPELPRVSPYFEQGMEWWGVFLFSIHVPALKRLTLIAGSATD
jgi:hypothetical protein